MKISLNWLKCRIIGHDFAYRVAFSDGQSCVTCARCGYTRGVTS